MKDISNKFETLRTARAEAIVTASKEAVAAAASGSTPKGEVWGVARTAGIVAAKRTDELIPYCHRIPIDHVSIDFETRGTEIRITAGAKAVAKTGVEMEALVAASVAALTCYDMLKPMDDAVAISSVRLVEKEGGKGDFQEKASVTAAVLVASDSIASGRKGDESGKAIVERLKGYGVQVKSCTVVPDDINQVTHTIQGWIKEGIELIITTGGTGLGPRDVTVEAVKALIDREVPGISEAIRNYGQCRTPYSMLSRGVSGINGKTLIVTLPGSSRGAIESIDAIFPAVLHAFRMMKGEGHDF